jgi:Fe-S cluster assembly iron-binding protein IscA
MLTLTDTAVVAVRSLVTNLDVDDDAGGLRIAAGERGDALDLALVDGPEGADAEVETGGAHVYLDSTAAQLLDDKVLDARLDEGRVQFVLEERGE